MLTSNSSMNGSEIERLIKSILNESTRYERELRSVHRERLVCPVVLKMDKSDEVCDAFSRNISRAGICLITQLPVADDAVADLEIYRLKEEPSVIVAKCCWCKPFGATYFMSGWQFVSIPRRKRNS